MYNFLVSALDNAWERTGYTYPRSRFLEYTEDHIASRFQELKDLQIAALLKLPCLFAYEGTLRPMRVGKLTRIRSRGKDLYIEFEIDRTSQPIAFERIEPLQAALDIREWELHRTHWAIKNEDLLAILSRDNLTPIDPETRGLVADVLPPPSQPEYRAVSVGDFVNKVLALGLGGEMFYRGHSNRAKYRLVPSLFRKDDRGNFRHLYLEDTLYRELLISNSADFQGDDYTLDRLVRMQHYSLPTRLLDITSNPLIALYFACKGSVDEEGEVVVLSVKSESIKYFDSDTASCIANLARLSQDSKTAIDYTTTSVTTFNKQRPLKRLLHFIREEKPFFEARMKPDDLRSVICVKGKRTNSRIAFQSGAFLLFGHDASLEESGSETISVLRFAVGDKAAMLRQLDQLNINESTVFPYIESSARYIAGKYVLSK